MAGQHPAKPFQPGNSHGIAHRFVKGQSGNPSGISALQRRFETWFYSALGNETIAKKAQTAFVKALERGEAWAHNLYWPRMLPAQPINLKLSRQEEEDDEKPDFSRLTPEEYETFGKLMAKVYPSGPKLLAEGSGQKALTKLR